MEGPSMFTDRKDLSVKDSYHKKPSQRQCNLHWKNRDMLHKTKKKKKSKIYTEAQRPKQSRVERTKLESSWSLVSGHPADQ